MYKSIHIVDFKLPTDSAAVLSIKNSDIRSYKENIKNKLISLTDYLLEEDSTLSANAIQNHLFPELEADIFLSHAHQDENEVIKLAILLEKKGLKVFVDSCVWDNAFDLLRAVDKEYCENSTPNSYNYDKRNYSTSNIYMILNTALHRMIYNSELLLFLDTPNSTKELTFKALIEEKKGLSSPWIFSELSFAQYVRRIDKRPKLKNNRFRVRLAEDRQISVEKAALSLKIHYPLPPLDYELSNTNFISWLNLTVATLFLCHKDLLQTYGKEITFLESFYQHVHKHGIRLTK